MTSEKSRLVNYVEFKQPCKVNLGDDRTIFAFGKGTYNLWHCRFGHLGMNGISKLINENMAEGMNCSDHGKQGLF